jgi:hypothetical protein
MADYVKTKMQATLALLGAIFALKPFLEDIKGIGFVYLDVSITLVHALSVMAVLLVVAIHCYALDMIRERPFSLVERLGNSSFAFAVLVLPIFGSGYGLTGLSAALAEQYQIPHLAWSGPAAAITVLAGWLLLAVLLRRRLSRQGQQAEFQRLVTAETAALQRAQEMFHHEHYDLSVIELWRAIEARLRRSLLVKSLRGPFDDWNSLREAAHEAGVLSKVPLATLDELRRHWEVAVGVEPLPRQAAESALVSTRRVLSMIPQ